MPEPGAGRARLGAITDTILDLESDIAELRQATTALHELCSRVVGFSDDTIEGPTAREIVLDQGRALSPRDAARCIFDFARTTALLRGVHEAIIEARQRFPGSRINLLYAGCGPFAPLALPLTTRFGAAELAITLLDAHEYSIDSAKRLAEYFGASAWIASLSCCDALDHQQPAANPLHILIIETMQKALEHEPQVALTQKLAPQLAEGGILIPERVRLSASLVDIGAEFTFREGGGNDPDSIEALRRRRLDLGGLFELSAAGLRSCAVVEQGGGKRKTTTVTIPDAVLRMPDLMVRTTVDVFGGHRLDDYESGISYPTLILQLGNFRPGDRIEFSYEGGPSPGLRIRRASPP